jgi:hypothetical protein
MYVLPMSVNLFAVLQNNPLTFSGIYGGRIDLVQVQCEKIVFFNGHRCRLKSIEIDVFF